MTLAARNPWRGRAAAYQKMLDALDRAAAIEGIERGLASAARALGRPAREVLDAIRRKHALSR